MADRTAAFFDTTTGALKGISQTAPDNILAGGLKRSSGDVTIDAGGANSIVLRTNGVSSVTVTSGGKLTTSSTTTTPALLIGSFAGDPSGLANGDIWYNSTTNKFRARENGATTDMIGGGGGASGWTDAGAEVHLTTSTDEVTVGPSGGTAGKFTVVGDTVGQKTIVAKQVAAQTAAALTIQNSAGTDLMTLTGLTTLTYQHTTALSNVTFRTADENTPGDGSAGSMILQTGVGADASGATAGGSGGGITIQNGDGGNASSTAGGTAGGGGSFVVNAGQGGSGNPTSGEINGASGGVMALTAGAGGTAGIGGVGGAGGGFTVYAGAAGSVGDGVTPGTAGAVAIYGGYGATGGIAGYGGTGGDATLQGGDGGYVNGGTAAGPGGTVYVRGGLGGAGDGSVAGTGGGYVYIVGGTGGSSGGAGGGAGGDVNINPGSGTSGGANGSLYIATALTPASFTIGTTAGTVTIQSKISSIATATRAAISVGGNAGDPSSLSNGDLWYNTSTNKFRARENGASVDLIGGGGASGWTDAGAEIHLTTSTDEVTVGASGGTLGKFTVRGDSAAQVSQAIRMAAAQTADALTIQNSAGTDIVRITADGYHTYNGYTEVNFAAAAAGAAGGSFDVFAGAGFDASAGAASGVGGFVVFMAGKGGNAFDAATRTASLGGNVDFTAGNGGDGVTGTNPSAGVSGGYINQLAGNGGAGSTTTAAGAGGWIIITGGDAGADNGGGGAVGGSVEIDAGIGTGASTNGSIYIGTTSTTAGIEIGGPAAVTISGKLITTSTATTPALLVGSFAGNPSGATNNGDIWYNSTTNKFRARENGVSVDLISVSGWTDDGTVVRLTTSTDNVTIGSATAGGKLFIDGDTDEIQLQVQGNATQTNNLFVVENSAGTDIFSVSLTGATVTGKLTVTGSLDPTDIVLSGGGTNHFMTFGNGSTVAVAAAGTGRIVYNDSVGIKNFQFSTDTGAFQTPPRSLGLVVATAMGFNLP